MLDPSLPWLASGYRNFQKGDFTKARSYDDITHLYHVQQEDFVKKELQTSTPELRQRRRVKSATSQRQQHKPHLGNERTARPKSAFGISALRDQALILGSSQSYNREKVGCYKYAPEQPPPQYFKPSKPRAKSAIYLRHRPSSLDQKSVSQVERQFHKERMYSLSVEEGNNHCAYCPNNCRPESSSSNRPVSSTGLMAAEMATHFDRYTLWTRPKSAAFMNGEFVQRPRHNYVNRGKVPHYSNFVKRIDLGLRNRTPSPSPLSPRRRRAFAEAVSPAPPREHRDSRKMLLGPKPDPEEPSDTKFHEERPNRIPTPVEGLPPAEINPLDVVASAWAKPRVPTPTPTTSPEPAEEEPIPKPSPSREPTPRPLEEPKASTPPFELEPIPDTPREPPSSLLVDPTSIKEPPPLPEPSPVQEPPPKPKKEVQIHDLPNGEPPLRPSSKNIERKPSNLVTKPLVIKKSPKPNPPTAELVQHNPCSKPELVEVKEDPKPPVQQAEILSLPEIRVEVPKSPVTIQIPGIISNDPFKEEVTLAIDETKEEVTTAKDETEEPKKQLRPQPQKIKMDLFGQARIHKYLPRCEQELLDLDIRSRRKGNVDDDEKDGYGSRYKNKDLIPNSAMKKSKLESWLKGRMALSKRASRFELPMDVRNLKDMTPIAYLERYCIVNRRRAALYKKAFSRVDRDCDFIINIKEMEKAVEDALVNTVHLDQIKRVLELIGVEQDIKMKPRLFSAICALLERLFYHEFVTEDTAEMEENTKERVEDADFSALDWKLKGYTVNPPLKKLLYRLL